MQAKEEINEKRKEKRKEKSITRICTSKSLLVVFPIAERTMTGLSLGKLRIRSATSLILSADATDEPPNFMAIVNCSVTPSVVWFSVLLFSSTSIDPPLQQTLKTFFLEESFTLLHNLEPPATDRVKSTRCDHRGWQCKDLLEETAQLGVVTPHKCNAPAILNQLKNFNVLFLS